MREYGQAQCSIWQSDAFEGCTDAGRLLAMYLLTGPHSNGLGCYKLPDGYVMEDLHWSSETVSKGFTELSGNGFAYRLGGVVFIPKYLRWNRIANGNVATARLTEFRALPKGEAKNRVAADILKYAKHLTSDQQTELNGFCRPSETVTQTVTETVTQTVCQTGSYPIRSDQDPIRSDQEPTLRGASEPRNGKYLDSVSLTYEQAQQLQSAYPVGIYRAADWLVVQKLVNQHLQNGVAFERMLCSCQRYAAQIRAKGKERTEFVLSPVKHFDLSTPLFDEQFPIPRTKAESQQDATTAAGLEFLRQGVRQ